MKTERIYLRVNDEEKKKIAELARARGLSISAYCISKVLNESTHTEVVNNTREAVDVHITLDKDILKQIDSNAKKSLMSRSGYIGKAVIENTVVFDGLKDFAKEINRLGSNINQIVMLANQGIMKTIDFKEFNELITEVISYLIEIKGGQVSAGSRKGGGKKRQDGQKKFL